MANKETRKLRRKGIKQGMREKEREECCKNKEKKAFRVCSFLLSNENETFICSVSLYV